MMDWPYLVNDQRGWLSWATKGREISVSAMRGVRSSWDAL